MTLESLKYVWINQTDRLLANGGSFKPQRNMSGLEGKSNPLEGFNSSLVHINRNLFKLQ
jgi:hypothetical protein